MTLDEYRLNLFLLDWTEKQEGWFKHPTEELNAYPTKILRKHKERYLKQVQVIQDPSDNQVESKFYTFQGHIDLLTTTTKDQ